MKYLIISEYKDLRQEHKIEGLILLDPFCQCYYTYDCNERNPKNVGRRLKKASITRGSSLYDLYFSYSDKIVIEDQIFNEILNLKIKDLHTFTLKDFLMRFKLYEWMI